MGWVKLKPNLKAKVRLINMASNGASAPLPCCRRMRGDRPVLRTILFLEARDLMWLWSVGCLAGRRHPHYFDFTTAAWATVSRSSADPGLLTEFSMKISAGVTGLP